MISTSSTPSSQTSIRRPAIFLSPSSSTNFGSTRLTSSPSVPARLQSAAVESGGGQTTRMSAPEVRLALVGALGVGKSALVVKYITKRFIMEYDPYLEDIYSKTETFESRTAVVKIMDTSESAEKKSERYLKWASAFIVVYSIVCRQSFDEAQKCLELITKYQRLTGNDGPIALVANKADLERYRTVSRGEGEQLAGRLDCAYFETSAAEDLSSVTAAFRRVLNDVLRLHDRQPTLQALYIDERGGKVTSSGLKVNSTTAMSDTSLQSKDDKLQQQQQQQQHPAPRKNFKLFNKGFRIFN